MTKDQTLATELRSRCSGHDFTDGVCIYCLAADEIERLQKENNDLRQNDGAMQRRLDELLGNPSVIVGLSAEPPRDLPNIPDCVEDVPR